MTVGIEEIEEFIIAETDYILKKSILKHIEKNMPGCIVRVTNRKRRGTFPDGCKITFS